MSIYFITFGSWGYYNAIALAKIGIRTYSVITTKSDLTLGRGFFRGKGNLNPIPIAEEGFRKLPREVPKEKIEKALQIISSNLPEKFFDEENLIVIACHTSGGTSASLAPELMRSLDEEGVAYITYGGFPHQQLSRTLWDNTLFFLEQTENVRSQPILVDPCRAIKTACEGEIPASFLVNNISLITDAINTGSIDVGELIGNFMQNKSPKTLLYRYENIGARRNIQSRLLGLFDRVEQDLKCKFLVGEASSVFCPGVRIHRSIQGVAGIMGIFFSAIKSVYGEDSNILDVRPIFSRRRGLDYSIIADINRRNLLSLVKRNAGMENKIGEEV